MSFEITGKLVKKYETETKGESFRVRDFVISTQDGQYENFVKFQTTQDRTSIIDDMNEGDEIKVHFDLRGRQWQDKYFTNLNAWRVEAATAGNAPAAPGNSSDTPGKFPSASDEPMVEADDDLPF